MTKYNVYAGYYEYFITKQNTHLNFPYQYQWTGNKQEITQFLEEQQQDSNNILVEQGIQDSFPLLYHQVFTYDNNRINLLNQDEHDSISVIIKDIVENYPKYTNLS